MESTEPLSQSKPIPIVGIGASAGGLGELQQCLSHVPPGSGMAIVIVHGRDLAILQGALHLQEPPEPRGLRLPIDTFFKSLVQDNRIDSVVIIFTDITASKNLESELRAAQARLAALNANASPHGVADGLS